MTTSRDRARRLTGRGRRRPLSAAARADFDDALAEVAALAGELSDEESAALLEECIAGCAQIAGIVPGHPLHSSVFPTATPSDD